jgi:hypothetical protein
VGQQRMGRALICGAGVEKGGAPTEPLWQGVALTSASFKRNKFSR